MFSPKVNPLRHFHTFYYFENGSGVQTWCVSSLRYSSALTEQEREKKGEGDETTQLNLLLEVKTNNKHFTQHEKKHMVKPHSHKRLKDCKLSLLPCVNDKMLLAVMRTQMPALRVETAQLFSI